MIFSSPERKSTFFFLVLDLKILSMKISALQRLTNTMNLYICTKEYLISIVVKENLWLGDTYGLLAVTGFSAIFMFLLITCEKNFRIRRGEGKRKYMKPVTKFHQQQKTLLLIHFAKKESWYLFILGINNCYLAERY